MTTIAYKGRVMAADTRIVGDGQALRGAPKIRRLPSGALLGVAGEADERDLAGLLAKVNAPDDLPAREQIGALRLDFSALLALKSGRLFLIESAKDEDAATFWGQVFEVRERFWAIGSGGKYALGAMAAGANVVAAIKAAARWDTSTGGPVEYIGL